jgi:hypothetical protein
MMNVLVIGDDWSTGITAGLEKFLSSKPDLHVFDGQALHQAELLDSTLPSIDVCIGTGVYLGAGQDLEDLLEDEIVQKGKRLALIDTAPILESSFGQTAGLRLPSDDVANEIKVALAGETPPSFERILEFIREKN